VEVGSAQRDGFAVCSVWLKKIVTAPTFSTQGSSAQEALRAVARALSAISPVIALHMPFVQDPEKRQALYDELLGMIYKNAR
jgi:hypothetical protein